MSSLVRIRLPSGVSPARLFTREPVARMMSVAWRTLAAVARPPSPVWVTRTRPGPSSLPRPWTQATLFLSTRVLRPGPHPLHDLVAAGRHLGVVDGRLAGEDDAVVLEVVGPVHHLGRFEERLGRDAAPMEAGPADLVLVDERDPEAELGGPEGGRVAAGPRAQDDEVEVVGGADGHGQMGSRTGRAMDVRRRGWVIDSMVRATSARGATVAVLGGRPASGARRDPRGVGPVARC